MFYAYAFDVSFLLNKACWFRFVDAGFCFLVNFLCRLNGKNMLGLLRGKRLVFVGDSLNRNMWESLLCLLRNSVDDKSGVVEALGRSEFRSEGSYSFVFKVCIA